MAASALLSEEAVKPPPRADVAPSRHWPSPLLQALLLGLLLAVAIVALYYPVHNYPFINFDDDAYVTANPYIQGVLGWSTVKWALLHSYLYNWHPLTWLSHALDIQLFQLEAGRHHEMNLALHVLNALLLFWVLRRATGCTGRSFMVAALFALHPINVESVVWIAERKTLLSTTFFLLALGAYHWYSLRPRRLRMALVVFLYGLGLMAKPQVITLPFVLLLWDYWPLHRMGAAGQPESEGETIPARSFAALVKEKIPLFAICVLDAVITLIAQHAASGSAGPYTLPLRLENALTAYVQYVGQAFWPVNLAILYLHPLQSLRWWQALAALLVLLGISALVIANRSHRYLLVGWLWFLGTLVPMIGAVQVYLQARADRYAYVSFIGLFLMVCWGVADWAKQQHLPRAILPAVSVAILLAAAAVTHREIGYWQDDVTLWTHTLEVTRRNWVAEYQLGRALQSQGQLDEAMQHFYRAAAEMTRRDIPVNLSIARGEQQRGNPRQAVEYYKKVLEVLGDPQQRAPVLSDMCLAYSTLDDHVNAIACLAEAAGTPTRSAVDWQGDWWRDLGRVIRNDIRKWRSGHGSSPSRR